MRVIVQGGPGGTGGSMLGALMSAAIVVGVVVAITGGVLIVLILSIPLVAIALVGVGAKGLARRMRALFTGSDDEGRRNVRVVDGTDAPGAP